MQDEDKPWVPGGIRQPGGGYMFLSDATLSDLEQGVAAEEYEAREQSFLDNDEAAEHHRKRAEGFAWEIARRRAAGETT